jgi:hypothetical protein
MGLRTLTEPEIIVRLQRSIRRSSEPWKGHSFLAAQQSRKGAWLQLPQAHFRIRFEAFAGDSNICLTVH